jgi:arylsulfatase A-like enzyme
MSVRRGSPLLLTLAAICILPADGLAQCTLTSEANAVLRSARARARCNDRALRFGPGQFCPAPPAPPACAGTLVDDAMALAYGANDPAAAGVDRQALRDQLRCQQHLGRAVADFIGRKLQNLILGRTRAEAEFRARRQLDRLPVRCGVGVVEDVSTVVVPDVGPACDVNVGAPGTAVEPEELRDCLITRLESAVDAVAPGGPPLKPNVIIILSDDQRWDTLDATHESPVRPGPVMPLVTQRLIDQGVLFSNGFVTRALCCPSRASILRGAYASTTGIHRNMPPNGGAQDFTNNGLDDETIATWLDAAGYRTGLYGKYLNGYASLWTLPAPPYVPPGWDEWHAFKATKFYDYVLVENGTEVSYPSGCTNYDGCPADEVGEDPCPTPLNYSTDVLAAKALDFIDDAVTAGEPFFLYFAPYAPHAPACPAKRHETLFQTVPLWRPANYDVADTDDPQWVQDFHPMPTNKKNNIDALRRYQLGSLQAVDEAVGAIMDKLEERGVADDTLVVYTADNGFSWGSHCHQPKSCAYEECMRVPLVIRYPLLAPEARVDERFGLNIDFALTFGELAGVVPPIPTDGRSLTRVLANTEKVWRDDFLFEHWDNDDDPNSGIPTLAAVRNERWKYVEYDTLEKELYDLASDPFELNNLAGELPYAAIETELAARLRELRPDWNP